ncbi:efflux RND transporter permease subunit [Desulfocurvibacter africanus]|uniref:efflux RND transporter permease subunit n=2 Tax=Desulfocurvibacter africanus TaxID=873 RepID=UPI0003FD81BC|nr:CusA/CzcA family heavy metal efflux RND transporter [Desulfocurvibacter africanus]
MVERIIEYSARHRFIVFLFVGVLALAGWWSFRAMPKDALPDLSDTQVIVYTTWMGRSPDLIEDQITYPIVTALLSAPRVTVVRGVSDFGFSYVYVLFEEGTDIYWARSRILEYLSQLRGRLPAGIEPALGPDATGVGWVFQYALVDDEGRYDLSQLRTIQDWYLRYQLASVEGVAEVASLGGFVRQYQVNLDPNKLAAYSLSIPQVIEAVRSANRETGGRVIEWGGTEFMVRGRGYVQSVEDIAAAPVSVTMQGVPIRLRDVATVTTGPDMRRGFADLNGTGDVVGGIVVMRFGENAQAVIARVKERLAEIEPTLPPGVKILTTYDRSSLINRAIRSISENLIEELVIISLLIIVFLWHFRSALVPIISLPLAVVISFIPMYFIGMGTNIMALGGIIVAIGDMVDAAIVMVENGVKRLTDAEATGQPHDRNEILISSAKEVGPPIFASLLVMAVSFLPILTLEAQEGRLFKPLAFTKNFAIAIAAILAITLIPAMLGLFVRGKLLPEAKHPINRRLIATYRPIVRFALKWRWLTVAVALLLFALSVPLYLRMGSEFMPPLNEGTILYMPITMPGISETEAQRLLQLQDKILMSFPEVALVSGKAGRAETSTDPSPFSMMETIVQLKPREQWRDVRIERPWLPGFLRPAADFLFGKHRKLSWDELVDQLDVALKLPGQQNAWTMPIKARIDMLTTGIRTPVGIKVMGRDLRAIDQLARHLEALLVTVPGTRSVFAERVLGGYYLDIAVDREEAARYGLSVAEVQMAVENAIGGENIDTTIMGRERYPVSVRYHRDFRSEMPDLGRVLVRAMNGAQIPLAQVATISRVPGPAMIRDEDGQLAAYVFVDVAGRDIGSYVTDAKAAVEGNIKMPAGYTIKWSGQYEFMERVKARLKVFVPLTLGIIFMLYYFTFGSVVETLLIMLSVPFALTGAIFLLSPDIGLGYNMSIAVWVGLIALAGVSAETVAIMLSYLDEAWKRRVEAGRMKDKSDLREAIMEGSVLRVRPMLMTALANIFGLMPVMVSTGTGADVMKRIAAPMVGGLASAVLLTLVLVPVLYSIWKERELKRMSGKG